MPLPALSRTWIRRVRRGRGFQYVRAGRRLRDGPDLARIESLTIPPAWRRVRIAVSARSRIQAVGRDARGRRQYRYHDGFRKRRDDEKFSRVSRFGLALPRIRRRVRRDLQGPGLSRQRVLALVVRILDETGARVGHDEYARTNRTFGVSSLRDHHVRRARDRLEVRFPGKGGKAVDLRIDDPRVARLVRRCKDQPGAHLFQYDDGRGPKKIRAGDVNGYLKTVAGEPFTTKDFRTWTASVACLRALTGTESPENQGTWRRLQTRAVRDVAALLGNTPAVCKRNYIHPLLLSAKTVSATRPGRRVPGLRVDEQRFLDFLRSHATRSRRRVIVGRG